MKKRRLALMLMISYAVMFGLYAVWYVKLSSDNYLSKDEVQGLILMVVALLVAVEILVYKKRYYWAGFLGCVFSAEDVCYYINSFEKNRFEFFVALLMLFVSLTVLVIDGFRQRKKGSKLFTILHILGLVILVANLYYDASLGLLINSHQGDRHLVVQKHDWQMLIVYPLLAIVCYEIKTIMGYTMAVFSSYYVWDYYLKNPDRYLWMELRSCRMETEFYERATELNRIAGDIGNITIVVLLLLILIRIIVSKWIKTCELQKSTNNSSEIQAGFSDRIMMKLNESIKSLARENKRDMVIMIMYVAAFISQLIPYLFDLPWRSGYVDRYILLIFDAFVAMTCMIVLIYKKRHFYAASLGCIFYSRGLNLFVINNWKNEWPEYLMTVIAFLLSFAILLVYCLKGRERSPLWINIINWLGLIWLLRTAYFNMSLGKVIESYDGEFHMEEANYFCHLLFVLSVVAVICYISKSWFGYGVAWYCVWSMWQKMTASSEFGPILSFDHECCMSDEYMRLGTAYLERAIEVNQLTMWVLAGFIVVSLGRVVWKAFR